MNIKEYKIEELALKINKDVLDKKGDLLTAMTGLEGSSKSTLGLLLQYAVDITFDLVSQVGYQLKQAPHLLLFTPRRRGIHFDENPFYKREHANKYQRFSMEALKQVRFQNHFMTACDTRIGDFDEYVRNHRIRLWFDVQKRGYAMIYKYDRKVKLGDPWHLDDEKERIRRNLVGFIRYPALEPDVQRRYDEIKNGGFDMLKNKYQELLDKDNGVKKDGRGRTPGVSYGKVGLIIKRTRAELNLTQQEYSDLLNIPVPTIRLWEQSAEKEEKQVIT